MLCFRKFPLAKNFMHKRGGGVSSFFVENFLLLSVEIFRWGNLECVSNCGYRKICCLRLLCHDFLAKIFCLTVPEKIVREPFCVPQKFWFRKISWMRGGGERVSITIFCQIFLSHSTESFCRRTLLCFTNF